MREIRVKLSERASPAMRTKLDGRVTSSEKMHSTFLIEEKGPAVRIPTPFSLIAVPLQLVGIIPRCFCKASVQPACEVFFTSKIARNGQLRFPSRRKTSNHRGDDARSQRPPPRPVARSTKVHEPKQMGDTRVQFDDISYGPCTRSDAGRPRSI